MSWAAIAAWAWMAIGATYAEPTMSLEMALRDELAILYGVSVYPGLEDDLRPGMALARSNGLIYDPPYLRLCNSHELHGRRMAIHNRTLRQRRIQVRAGDRTALSTGLELAKEAHPPLEDLLGIDLEPTGVMSHSLLRDAARGPVRPAESCLEAIHYAGTIDADPARIDQVVSGNLTIILVWRGETPITDAHLAATEYLARVLLGDHWVEVGRATIHAEDIVFGGADDGGAFLERMHL